MTANVYDRVIYVCAYIHIYIYKEKPTNKNNCFNMFRRIT